MSQPHSDALVFFGATGDLAYKKIFPALQAMIKRGTLDVPVIGVAKAGWNLDQLKARAKDSLEQHGGLDAAAWEKLSSLLRYVDGDYADPATFVAVRQGAGFGGASGALSGDSAFDVRDRGGATGEVGFGEGGADDRGEAVRSRSGFGAGAESDSAFGVS